MWAGQLTRVILLKGIAATETVRWGYLCKAKPWAAGVGCGRAFSPCWIELSFSSSG